MLCIQLTHERSCISNIGTKSKNVVGIKNYNTLSKSRVYSYFIVQPIPEPSFIILSRVYG
jgi:hypothetical protein